MIEITFLSPEPGGKRMLGFARFMAVPLANRKDFTCSPSDLISFSTAQYIATQLANDVVSGKIDDMEWQRS